MQLSDLTRRKRELPDRAALSLCKNKDKKLGDVYERVARQELDRCEMLHAQAVRLIREHGGEPNEAMRAVWEYEHDRSMELDAEIRVKLHLYDGR